MNYTPLFWFWVRYTLVDIQKLSLAVRLYYWCTIGQIHIELPTFWWQNKPVYFDVKDKLPTQKCVPVSRSACLLEVSRCTSIHDNPDIQRLNIVIMLIIHTRYYYKTHMSSSHFCIYDYISIFLFHSVFRSLPALCCNYLRCVLWTEIISETMRKHSSWQRS